MIPAVLLERLEGQLIFEVKQWLDECTNQHGDRYNIFQQQELNLPGECLSFTIIFCRMLLMFLIYVLLQGWQFIKGILRAR